MPDDRGQIVEATTACRVRGGPWRLLLSITLLPLAQAAAADPTSMLPGIGVAVGPEYFSWRELGSSGDTLLHETGPRLTLSISADDLNLQGPGLVYWVKGRGYVGYVNYSGESQPANLPVSSSTRYLGGLGEAGAGYRFWNVFDSFSIDVVGAAGVDQWQRVIGDSKTSGGTFVSGTAEDYRIWYMKTGLGLYHSNSRWMQYLQGGLKWPFSTHETAHLQAMGLGDVHVSPGRSPSFYLQWDLAGLDPAGERTYDLSIYYDSYRFNPSPPVAAGNAVIFQPESHQNVVGLQIGYYFNPF